MRNLILAFTCLFLVVPCQAAIITVDDDSPANFNNIQAAINVATNGDVVLVAPGRYTGPGNYDIDFHGKAITVRSTDPTDPCTVAATIIDCEGTGRGFVFHSGEDGNSVLNGFTITNGYGSRGGGIYCTRESSPTITNCTISGNTAADGGGIYCEDSSPTIANCTISRNAGWRGAGGIYCYDGGSPKITNCTISGNTASGGGGISCGDSNPTITNCTISDNTAGHFGGGGIRCWYSSPTIINCTISGNTAEGRNGGGGISCEYESNPTITNCTISGNTAEEDGGGISCDRYSSPTITNCTISGNTTDRYDGGGIYCWYSGPTITNCTINRNSAGNEGGGIYCEYKSSPTITNCTISGNTAEENGGGILCDESSLIINNSILWGNPRGQIVEYNSTVSVTYTDVQGGWEGKGNIGAGPLLTLDGHLRAGSPCIDAGDQSGNFTGQVDIDGEPRIIGTSVDMGSDEFLDSDSDGLPDWWESKYFGSNTAAEPNADPDMDGYTNLAEYELYSSDPTVAAVPAITYYVDAQEGDDAYDGLAPEWDGQHGPKRTIQAGIDAASASDTVIVATGRYVENINFKGKAITVRSSNPGDWEVVKNTVIDGVEGDRWNASCVVFDRGEGSNSILEGFTLKNGRGTWMLNHWFDGRIGGGILCLDSSPTIRRCNIKANGLGEYEEPEVDYGGGIALIGNCQATITDCFIVNNEAKLNGAGIIIRSNTPEQARSTITNCTIANNNIYTYFWWYDYERYEVDCWDTRPSISNTIIWSHNPRLQRGLLIVDPSLVTYSCIKDAYIFEGSYGEAVPYDLTVAGGNISEWPRFVRAFGPDPFNPGGYCGDVPGYYDPDCPYPEPADYRDYHLLTDSPCIDAGDPTGNYSGQTDIDGQPRVMGGGVDIGADEVVPEMIVTKPAGGEVWSAGSIHGIEWSSYGAGSVDILFSTDAGDNWQTIKSSVPDTGSYTWRILNKMCSEQAQVSVVPSVPDANTVCIESGVFEIQPYHGPASLPQRRKEPGRKPGEKSGPELGCVKWQFQTDGPVTAGVTIGRQIARQTKVYVACEDGKLYTLDLDTGSLIWSYDVNSALIGSAAEGPQGSVYVGSTDGKLYAIDKDGLLLWTHTTEAPIFSSPVVSPQAQIYICSEDGTLYALRRNGTKLWSFETAGFAALGGSIFATPAIDADGTIYTAGIYDPNLYALEPEDGSVKWNCNFESQGWPFASPAVAADGTIYQTLLYDSNLYAIQPESGIIDWSTDLADPCSGWFEPNYADIYGNADGWSRPALGPDGTIYVSFDDPYLRAVDPDGDIRWVTKLGTIGGFTLTVGSDELIYAASDDAHLYVVNPDGEEIARFEGNGYLSFPVIAAGHTLIVSDANNMVWAIGQEDCQDEALVLHRPED